jgi:hypothetical protein
MSLRSFTLSASFCLLRPTRLNRFPSLFATLLGGQISSASLSADTALFAEELYSGFR